MRIFIFLFLLVIGNLLFAQNQLKEYYKSTFNCESDTCLVNNLNNTYKKLRYNVPDSSNSIIELALEISEKNNYTYGHTVALYCKADFLIYEVKYNEALEICNQIIKISEENNFIDVQLDTYNLMGIIYSDQAYYDESIKNYQKSYDLALESNNKKGIAKALSNIGVTYYFLSDYSLAIEYYHKSLKILEEEKDSVNTSILLSNLAVFYQLQGQFDKALETLNKAIEYLNKADYRSLADTYNNIAVTHMYKGDLPNAIEFYQKSIKLREKINDIRGLAASYNNIGDVYTKLGKFNLALENIQKSVDITKEANIQTDYAHYTRSLAVTYFYSGDYANAELYALKSTEIALELGNKSMVRDNYDLIADACRGARKFEKATEYMFLYKDLNDSIVQEEYAQSVADMETKYETEKKQKEIELLNKDNELKNEEIQKQRILTYSFILGFVIILIFSILLYKQFSQKKKAYIELELKNAQIISQKEEIEAQRDEIEVQRDFVTKQRDLISEQKEEITDSIHYASRIQSAILPQQEIIEAFLPNHFILFMPRDIVSGDFYWIKESNEKMLFCAADCTGHGVPGAFMSMLGIASLNEIVNNNTFNNAAEILDQLRTNIVLSLHQSGKEGKSKDGMDISLCIYDKTQNKLDFAGANNPLYLIRNNELIEYKGDKMPISIYEKMEHFTNHEIEINKEDSIYLFSDGFADQFGGPNGKKFKYKKFKETLLENHTLPINRQKENLKHTFEIWRGELEQIDDVLVLGIKF